MFLRCKSATRRWRSTPRNLKVLRPSGRRVCLRPMTAVSHLYPLVAIPPATTLRSPSRSWSLLLMPSMTKQRLGWQQCISTNHSLLNGGCQITSSNAQKFLLYFTVSELSISCHNKVHLFLKHTCGSDAVKFHIADGKWCKQIHPTTLERTDPLVQPAWAAVWLS